MRPKGLGLAAALLFAALAPAAVISAPKEAPKIDPAAIKAGMDAAPAIVQAAGLPCQVSGARLLGKMAEDKKKGTPASTVIEVACGPGGMGFILQAPVGAAPEAYSCLEVNAQAEGKPGAPMCLLPDNADPKGALRGPLAKAGVTCTPTNARGIGHTKSQSFYEVACQEGSGYVVITAAPYDPSKPVQAQNCLNFDEGNGNIKCTLSDKAARLAMVDRLVAGTKTNCTVKDKRFVGTSQDGADFYETSCSDGKGYIYKVSGGAVSQSWDCAHATNILGGCQLTDARQAQSEEAATYTRLAKESGSSCQVSKYAEFPMKGNDEVVELLCVDGKSAVGIFPATGKGQVLDCGRALAAGYKCGLGKPDYAGLTADVKKFAPQSTCSVSDARLAARTQKGTILVEVACSDGLPGYMVEYNTTPSVAAVSSTGCRLAGGCQLPGNKTS